MRRIALIFVWAACTCLTMAQTTVTGTAQVRLDTGTILPLYGLPVQLPITIDLSGATGPGGSSLLLGGYLVPVSFNPAVLHFETARNVGLPGQSGTGAASYATPSDMANSNGLAALTAVTTSGTSAVHTNPVGQVILRVSGFGSLNLGIVTTALSAFPQVKLQIFSRRTSSQPPLAIPFSSTAPPSLKCTGRLILAEGDYNRASKSQLAIYRPAEGTWRIMDAATGTVLTEKHLGEPGDIPVSGDYNGDGYTDLAIFRPSTGMWFAMDARPGNDSIYLNLTLGAQGDIPVPGDYNADGRTDPAVYRPSNYTWYLYDAVAMKSLATKVYGTADAIPVPGDYNLDNRTEIAYFRTSTYYWYAQDARSGNSKVYVSKKYGVAGCIPVPGDYNGEGRTELAYFVPATSTWMAMDARSTSSSKYVNKVCGQAGDIPVPADFNGDGRTDLGIFRPSTGLWYALDARSTVSTVYVNRIFGDAMDLAIAR